MGRRASHRRLRRPGPWLATALLLVGGCVAPLEPTTTDPHPEQTLASRLNLAARNKDPGAFMANFANPDGYRLGARWYRVMTSAGASVEVPPGGSMLEVSWKLPGDDEEASNVLYVALGTQAGRPVITGLRTSPQVPLWTLEMLDVTAASHGTLLSSGLTADERARLGQQLDAAAALVARADVIPEGIEWDGGIVVERPRTSADFVVVTGLNAAETGGVAACGTGTPRITLSPQLTDEWLEPVLLHESVHAAVESPCSSAGEHWAVEGLAEWVSQEAYPVMADENRALVRSHLAASGVPDDLPDAIDSTTDYALAAVAVGQVFAHLGHDDAVELVDRFARTDAATKAERDQVRTWYLDELTRRAATP